MDDLIRLSENNPQNYFNYLKLKESCRYFFNDKTIIHGYSDIDRFIFEASKKTGIDPKKLKSFSRKINLYIILLNLFLLKSHYTNYQLIYHLKLSYPF